jgi:cellulose biosynthesis protein BcsQ
MDSPPRGPSGPVVAVSSNKGGVGKTTLATNLAVYVRALREDLPVLVVGLDDQRTLDRMFALSPNALAGAPNLKHAWAERCLNSAIQLGEYGVHFVPSPPDVSLLKARAEDPRALARIIEASEWPGLLILDTKSDLEALTQSAWHAAQRILLPVSDWASLEEAGKIFRQLDRAGLGAARARIVFTLVDRRTRSDGGDHQLFERLVEEVRWRGWPRYEATLSRSPRVETLNSGSERPRSILHHARGTAIYGEMRDLCFELMRDLRLDELPAPAAAPATETSAELWGAPRSARAEAARRWRGWRNR